MIHEKWAISDTHFFHANILKFKGVDNVSPLRPFVSIEEMHTTMITNWNSLVGVNDNVYHLGDVTFGYSKGFNELMSQLNGRKRLILGNHDRIKGTDLLKWFEKVDLWSSPVEEFTLSHMPLKEGHFRSGRVNVHGHTHANLVAGPYLNVCVETRNYMPVHFDTLIAEANDIIRDLDNRDQINKHLNR